MNNKPRHKQELTESDIDRIVAEQVHDDSAWEKPIHVKRGKAASLSIPADLAARAAFLARLHRIKNVERWIMTIIQERIELEEAAFAGVKRELADK